MNTCEPISTRECYPILNNKNHKTTVSKELLVIDLYRILFECFCVLYIVIMCSY